MHFGFVPNQILFVTKNRFHFEAYFFLFNKKLYIVKVNLTLIFIRLKFQLYNVLYIMKK